MINLIDMIEDFCIIFDKELFPIIRGSTSSKYFFILFLTNEVWALLSDKERVNEIAEMLSGDKSNKSANELANELLN